jgi:cell division protein FtsB
MKMIKWLIANQKQVASGAALFLLVICYLQQKQMATLRTEVVTIKQTADNLHDELFIKSTEVGRYELTLEHMKNVNPKAAYEFEQYMSHETE